MLDFFFCSLANERVSVWAHYAKTLKSTMTCRIIFYYTFLIYFWVVEVSSCIEMNWFSKMNCLFNGFGFSFDYYPIEKQSEGVVYFKGVDLICLVDNFWIFKLELLDNLRPVSPKPGHMERVRTPLGGTNPIMETEERPFEERFLKISVHHITDGQVRKENCQ